MTEKRTLNSIVTPGIGKMTSRDILLDKKSLKSLVLEEKEISPNTFEIVKEVHEKITITLEAGNYVKVLVEDVEGNKKEYFVTEGVIDVVLSTEVIDVN